MKTRCVVTWKIAEAAVLALALVSLVSCGGGSLPTPQEFLGWLWAKTYGGPGIDVAFSIQQTGDGGYIVAGGTNSFGSVGFDFWVLKLNPDGTVAWQKTYGGSGIDVAHSIQQTSDGGYIVAGSTNSFGAGGYDIWVLKLNSDGTVAWQKTYGGASSDGASSIRQTSDGGYIVAGGTNSFGAGEGDIWVLKLNSDGTVAWQKTYGGAGDDLAFSIQQTSDGGYIVAGRTYSFGAGERDFWVLKLNSDGTVAWQKTYGGGVIDEATSIQQTSDGGYIVAGYTSSFGAGGDDIWVLKLDGDGNVAWQKTYGGGSDDEAHSIQQTNDGGYVVAGRTSSFGAGGDDIWVLKLDGDGNVAWQKTYGGASDDEANSIQQTSDGGYVVAGSTKSFGAGDADYWVLKLKSNGNIVFNSTSGASTTDTSVTPSDSSVSPPNSAASISNTTATVTDTTVVPTDTNATITQQAP